MAFSRERLESFQEGRARASPRKLPKVDGVCEGRASPSSASTAPQPRSVFSQLFPNRYTRKGGLLGKTRRGSHCDRVSIRRTLNTIFLETALRRERHTLSRNHIEMIRTLRGLRAPEREREREAVEAWRFARENTTERRSRTGTGSTLRARVASPGSVLQHGTVQRPFEFRECTGDESRGSGKIFESSKNAFQRSPSALLRRLSTVWESRRRHLGRDTKSVAQKREAPLDSARQARCARWTERACPSAAAAAHAAASSSASPSSAPSTEQRPTRGVDGSGRS